MSSAPDRRPVPRALYVYLWALIGFTAIALLIVWYRGHILHLDYPYNSLLFIPPERFSDLTHYLEKCKLFQTTGVFNGGEEPTWIYPAPSVYLECSMINYAPRPVYFLIAATFAIAAIAALLLWRQCRKSESHWKLAACVIFATCLTSYPFAFLLDRANMEALVMGVLLVFIIFFVREKYLWAALTLMVAACIKPYPIIFFAMFLFRRKFREIAIAGLCYVLVTYVSLAGLGTPVMESYRGIQDGMKWFVENRVSMINESEIGFDHSLFAVVKRVYKVLAGPFPDRPDAYGVLYQPYFMVAAAIGVLTLLRVWRMPVLNQFLALTIVITLFPWLSYDYTLVQIYLPWGMFLIVLLDEDARNAPRITYQQALLVLLPCAFLFTPQSYLMMKTTASGFGGQFKALALLTLFLTSLIYRWPSRIFGDRQEAQATG